MLESKVLETLMSKNETEKYDEFVNAQKLAAVMMDIVSSTESGIIRLEPKEHLSMKDPMDTTLKI